MAREKINSRSLYLITLEQYIHTYQPSMKAKEVTVKSRYQDSDNQEVDEKGDSATNEDTGAYFLTSLTDLKNYLINDELKFLTLPAKDISLRNDYLACIHTSQSPLSQFCMNVVFMAYFIFLLERNSHEVAMQLTSWLFPVLILCIFLTIVTFISGWTLFFALCREHYFSRMSTERSDERCKKLRGNKLIASSVFAFSFTILNSIYLVTKVVAGQCDDVGQNIGSDLCNPYADTQGVPFDTALVLILGCFLTVAVQRESRKWVISFIWIITIGSLAFCAAYMRSSPVVLYLLIYTFVSPLIILDLLKVNFENFLKTRRLQEALLENENNAAEERATEMRHMIANIAHDLKTVKKQLHE